MGEHVGRGKGAVGREAVERTGEHLVVRRRRTPATRGYGEEVEKSVREESKCRRLLYHGSGEQVNSELRCGEGNAERAVRRGTQWRACMALLEPGFVQHLKMRPQQSMPWCQDGGVLRMAAPLLRRSMPSGHTFPRRRWRWCAMPVDTTGPLGNKAGEGAT